jgi:D-amino-acid dehydrogenase
MLPRVGRGRAVCIFYNTGHGHLGWTLSAVTADMVAGVVEQAMGPAPVVVPVVVPSVAPALRKA